MICTKTVAIEIVERVQAWLKLDNADPALNTDSVTGNPVIVGSPADAVAVPAVISNGVQMINGVGNVVLLQGEWLSYKGTGWSLCFWNLAADMDVRYGWDASTVNSVVQVVHDGGNISMFISIEGTGPDVVPIGLVPSAVFHFFCVTYDPDDGKFRGSIDNAPFVVSPLNYAFAAFNGPTSNIWIQDVFLGLDPVFDEVCLLSVPVSIAQRDYLFNGGSGRTFPISLPPP